MIADQFCQSDALIKPKRKCTTLLLSLRNKICPLSLSATYLDFLKSLNLQPKVVDL